jgi:hypothetical protein
MQHQLGDDWGWEEPSDEHLWGEANEYHFKVKEGLRTTLRAAMRAGDALLALRERAAHGTWAQLLAENFRGSHATANVYMRLAANRDRLRPLFYGRGGLWPSDQLTIQKAMRMLRTPRAAAAGTAAAPVGDEPVPAAGEPDPPAAVAEAVVDEACGVVRACLRFLPHDEILFWGRWLSWDGLREFVMARAAGMREVAHVVMDGCRWREEMERTFPEEPPELWAWRFRERVERAFEGRTDLTGDQWRMVLQVITE